MRVEITGLTKTYADGTVALRGLDLILDGGIYGLLGPNGAGKTTLLSMLVLAVEPTAGRRVYDGLDARRPAARPAIRRLLGFLPQDFAPIPYLTGYEYLVHCARLRSVPISGRELSRRALELLDVVGLTRASDRASSGYSGGMRRRLGVAQALIHAPELVVVDEPTAGLDPEERMQFRNLMSDIADHASVVLSTHIVEDIEAICPRIGVIAAGRLLFDGSSSAVIRDHAGRLWDIDATAVDQRDVVIGRRVDDWGQARAIVLAETAPAAARAHEPTLEEACSALLARQGVTLEANPAESAAEATVR